MTERQQNTQYNENEIDLKELFGILWKNKITILSTTLIGAILAGVLSVFILTPVYDTEFKIDLNFPETYNTRFGEYKLPISSNDQYIQLITSNDVCNKAIKSMGYNPKKVTLEKLKEKISVGKAVISSSSTQNIFDITVSERSPEESLKLANTLYENYVKYIDYLCNEKALGHYYSSVKADIESNKYILASTKEILNKNEELLAKTPQTIDQKALTNSNYIVIENIINPAYSKIQENIVENKNLIFTTEDTINTKKEYLNKINMAIKSIRKYGETGSIDNPELRLLNITESNIFLASKPVQPTQKTSPSTTKNIALGLVGGGIIGFLIILLKGYILKKE